MLSSKVPSLISEGFSIDEIMKITGCGRRTVYNYRCRMGLEAPERTPASARDWGAVQKIYNSGVSMKKSASRMGICWRTACKALSEGWIKCDPSRKYISHSDLFSASPEKRRGSVKRRIINRKIIPYICSMCGQAPEWKGKPLVLILDHINGINHDDRIENLRFVCPNCDSQLPTYKRKNKRRAPKLE